MHDVLQCTFITFSFGPFENNISAHSEEPDECCQQDAMDFECCCQNQTNGELNLGGVIRESPCTLKVFIYAYVAFKVGTIYTEKSCSSSSEENR